MDQKPPRTRSRTGCLTCRKHKKKCDEKAYPTCQRCQSRHLKCLWPEGKQQLFEKLKDIKYVGEDKGIRLKPPPSLPPSVSVTSSSSQKITKTYPKDEILSRIAWQQDCVGDDNKQPH